MNPNDTVRVGLGEFDYEVNAEFADALLHALLELREWIHSLNLPSDALARKPFLDYGIHAALDDGSPAFFHAMV